MSKKPVAKKKPAKSAKQAKPAKAAKPVKAAPRAVAKAVPKMAPKAAPKADPGGAAVVLFTLRDSGATALRFHSDHADIGRARAVAQGLANSADVADAFILRNVEIMHGGNSA